MIERSISHYSIVKMLGAGGMGEVYLAEDVQLGRRVALKLLPADVASDEGRMRRFIQEARAASALNLSLVCARSALAAVRQRPGVPAFHGGFEEILGIGESSVYASKGIEFRKVLCV